MNLRKVKAMIAGHRPPGASAGETDVLGGIVLGWRKELVRLLNEIDADAMALASGDVTELAVAMTELAEDLHTDSGLWRGLEAGNTAHFDTPLPLIWQAGDAALTRFDARRFRFFLHSVWRHFMPNLIISPAHRGFVTIADGAEAFFGGAFAGYSHISSVTVFLKTSNARGWDVKRKLIWFGTHGFLLRFAYADYLARNKPKARDAITATDDYLCQESTAWSGFGALDLLAVTLDLPEADRTALRGWNERHAAFYRVDAMQIKGIVVETLKVVNLINDQAYCIRMDIPRNECPFANKEMVFGSLVLWHGEWYWSGAQERWPQVPVDFQMIRRGMIEKNSAIVYRYCPDLAKRAREISVEYHASFVGFHGSDLAVFADGLTAAAAEQRRIREQNEAKTGAKMPVFLARHGSNRSGPKISLPKDLIECRRGIAIFSHAGEGTELMADFDVLRTALGKSDDALSEDEAEVLQAFIESEAISPAFVRRVIQDYGRASLSALYYLPTGNDSEVEYLLRRFKGHFYRRRFPCISLLQE